ncbi:hypothetical protein X801_06749, partial [Opisthorchis viverrini]
MSSYHANLPALVMTSGGVVDEGSLSTAGCSEFRSDKGSELNTALAAVFGNLEFLLHPDSNKFKADAASLGQHTKEVAPRAIATKTSDQQICSPCYSISQVPKAEAFNYGCVRNTTDGRPCIWFSMEVDMAGSTTTKAKAVRDIWLRMAAVQE